MQKLTAPALGRTLLAISLTGLLSAPGLAQTSAADESLSDSEEVVTLSPFEVAVDSDVGYLATETLSGSRLRTDLRDIGASISVVTQEMLNDLAATNNETLLAWLTNAEVGGPAGNYSGGPTISGVDFGPRENDLFLNPSQNNRVRGLSSADNTRNYFLSDVPWDGYNTSRVDFQRGPNAMLAGLGSPAGLINTVPDQAIFRNRGQVAVRIDKFGSLRGSLNANQVLLEDELAVRVAALSDHQKFRQDPAYQDTDRYYGAVRYEPGFLNSANTRFEIKADVEYGKITSNRPRNVTPQDNITPFFAGGPWGFDRQTYNHLTDTRPSGIQTGNSGYDPVYYINSPSAPFATNHPGGVSANSRFLIENIPNGYGTLNRNGEVQGVNGVPTGSASVDGVNRPLWVIGAKNQIASAIDADYAGFYGIETLSDPGVFDFYNQLIDGPNKGEESEWTVFDVSVSQTFLQNAFGYDVAFSQQDLDQLRFAAMGWGNRLFIDINERNPDGSANPNVGRAYISEKLQQTGQRNYERDRDSVRAQAFATHDFSKGHDSFLRRLLGQQTLTGLWSEETAERKSWGTKAYAVDPNFNALFTSNSNTAGNAVTPVFKQYVSDDLRDIGSISDINATNLSANVLFQQNTIPVTYWDPTWIATGVNAGDPWNLPTGFTGSPVDVPADGSNPAVGIQASNPANYRGWTTQDVRVYSPFIDPNETVEGTGLTVRDYLAVGASAAQSRVRSEMLIWQGRLLDGAIAGLYGWRKDKAFSYVYNQNGTPDARSDGGANLDPSVLNFDNPLGQRAELEGTSRNWSVALHLNRLMGERDFLPFNLSLYYNQGENFQPKDGRVDLSGMELPAPIGETEEYSVLLATKDNRFSVKVTRYETTETNAALTAGLQNWAFEQTMDMKNFWTPAAFYEQVTRFENGETGPGGNRNRTPINIDTLNVTDARRDELRRGVVGWREFMTAMVQEFPEFVDSFGGINTPRNEYYPAGYGFWLGRKNWAFTEDRQSKGYEIEFVANPTKDWRVMLNVSKTEAVRTNVPGDYNGRFLDFVDHWLWETDAGLLPVYSTTGSPLREAPYNNFHNSYLQAKALNGQRAGEVREWKVNMFTNYSFSEGMLKGLGVGGGVRWEDESTIGYDVSTLTNEVGQDYDIIDVTKPFYADAETTVNLWASYNKPLSEKLRWKIQVNVNNVFGSNKVIPISTQPGGAGAVYRIKEGTSWSVTNTFSF